MKKWSKRILIGIGIVVVLAAVGLAKFKPLDVDTQTVRKGKVTASVVEKGKVVSEATEDTVSEVQGKIKDIYADEGDMVTKGKLLAVVDTAELEARMAQLEGELKALKGMERVSPADSNQVRQHQLAVEQAGIAFERARSDFDRTQNLFMEGAVTALEMERAKAELETSRKALAQAEAALALAKQQSRGSKLQYQGQRESIQAQLKHMGEQKAKARITANRDGVVFTKHVKAGDYVNPGSKLFSIGTRAQVRIETYINSKDMANVRKGDKVGVVFKVPGEDIKLAGLITRIAPVTEERTSSLGIIEDKVKVTVELDKYPDGIQLIPGMTVDVVVVTREAVNVPGVPKDAVFTDQGKDYVWVVRKGSAVLVQVRKGIEGDELVEVKSGLTEGEQVIMNPHQTELKEGIKVK